MALGAEETVGLSTSSSSIPAHQTLVLMDPDGDGSSIIFEDGPNSVSRQVRREWDLGRLFGGQMAQWLRYPFEG